MAGALIVTAVLAGPDLAWLDGLRRAYYPPERNQLPAHLTMFHALPPSAETEARRRLAQAAARRAPRATVAGLMDLGATLCTRSSPDCGRCPLQQRCVAYATGRTAELPVRKPKKAVPEKQAALMAVVHGGQVLLEQRPDSGIWGGLMSLPELDGHQARDGEALAIEDVVRAAGVFGEVEETEALLPLVHVFTHYKLHIAPYRIGLAKRAELDSRYVWWDMARIGQAPLPAPVKKLLGQLAVPGLFG